MESNLDSDHHTMVLVIRFNSIATYDGIIRFNSTASSYYGIIRFNSTASAGGGGDLAPPRAFVLCLLCFDLDLCMCVGWTPIQSLSSWDESGRMNPLFFQLIVKSLNSKSIVNLFWKH